MKANELRVGNWVIVKDAPAEVVLQVRAQHIAEAEEHNPSWFLYPIPLTPEVLEKCGFVEQMGRHGVYSKNRLRIVLGIGALAYLIDEDDSRGYYIPNPCINLHQLQNLYFALTGTELEYNPIKETV